MAQLVMKIPADIIQSWEVAGNSVGQIVDFLNVPAPVFESISEPTGIDRDSSAGDVAFIEPDEWLTMVSPLAVDGAAPDFTWEE